MIREPALRQMLRAAIVVAALITATVAIAGGGSPTAPAASGSPSTPAGPTPSTLDARYADKNGDLVADAPADPRQWLDPDELVFAYTPIEDPAVYRQAWAGFLDYLAQKTGKKVTFFAVQSNAAEIEAMRAGRLHVAGFSSGSVPFAVNVAGFVPLTIMAHKDGSYGYEMEIVVRRDSPIKAPADLKGRTLACSSPTSNSGYKAPLALLKSEFHLEPGRDFKLALSGKHDNTLLGVVNEDYDAGAIANEVWKRMVSRGMVAPDALRSIYKSPTFPSTAYGIAFNVDPKLAQKIKDAFFSFPWAGSKLAEEFRETDGEKFIAIDYRRDWALIRKIDEASGVTYASGNVR